MSSTGCRLLRGEGIRLCLRCRFLLCCSARLFLSGLRLSLGSLSLGSLSLRLSLSGVGSLQLFLVLLLQCLQDIVCSAEHRDDAIAQEKQLICGRKRCIPMGNHDNRFATLTQVRHCLS